MNIEKRPHMQKIQNIVFPLNNVLKNIWVFPNIFFLFYSNSILLIQNIVLVVHSYILWYIHMNVFQEQCFESIKLEQYFETILAKHCYVLGFAIVLGKNNVLNFLVAAIS